MNNFNIMSLLGHAQNRQNARIKRLRGRKRTASGGAWNRQSQHANIIFGNYICLMMMCGWSCHGVVDVLHACAMTYRNHVE